MNRVKNAGKSRHLDKFEFQEWMMEKVLILCEKMFLIRCRVRCMLVAGVHLVCHLIVVGQVASSENRPSPKQARWKIFKSSGAHWHIGVSKVPIYIIALCNGSKISFHTKLELFPSFILEIRSCPNADIFHYSWSYSFILVWVNFTFTRVKKIQYVVVFFKCKTWSIDGA